MIVKRNHHSMEYASFINSHSWQVKNEEIPQSGAAEKFWERRAKFKELTFLTNANFSVGENFYKKT